MTKEEFSTQHEQLFCHCGQLLTEHLRNEDVVPLNSHTVKMILDELLRQDKPTLSDSARYQEVECIHHQISQHEIFPPRMVRMSQSLARSWVFLALRKSGIPLGVESEFDKLFLRLTPDLHRLNQQQNTKYHSVRQLNGSFLFPCRVFAFVGKSLISIKRVILQGILRLLKRKNP